MPDSPELKPSSPPKGGKKENVLTRKLGPLPTWAWVAIVAVLLIGYYYLKNKQSSGSTTATGTSAADVPQFVNQTYTTVVPPTAPGPDHDHDKDHKGKPSLIPWKDEGKKDKKIKAWEHKHHTEYPFNTWMGEPTAAQLAAFKANPTVEPSFPSQSNQWPIDPVMGVRPQPAQVVPGG